MKLYFAPGACSLAPHIAVRETGIACDIDKVDFATKKTASGQDFASVNPKGSVPALQLDDGQVMTEAAVLLQYIADQKPGAGLIPAAGSLQRYRVQEWLNYLATEVHKLFGAMFGPMPDAAKAAIKETMIPAKLDYLNKALEKNDTLTGSYSVADIYLFTILGWTGFLQMDLAKWPALVKFRERVGARPAVQAALKAEGLA